MSVPGCSIWFSPSGSVLVTLGVSPDETGLAAVLTLEDALRRKFDWLDQTIPAFNGLLLTGPFHRQDPDRVKAEVMRLAEDALRAPRPLPSLTRVEFPICYHPELAPDLAELAGKAGITTEAFARAHAARTYTVLATGFAPGFAYLGDLEPLLAAPRRPEPRPVVPAGSVGIADHRTGVYPSEGPGGWNLIGRVPPALFEDAAERTARFEPGARVRFRPVTRTDFHKE